MESLTKKHILNIHSLDQSMWMRTDFFALPVEILLLFFSISQGLLKQGNCNTAHGKRPSFILVAYIILICTKK